MEAQSRIHPIPRFDQILERKTKSRHKDHLKGWGVWVGVEKECPKYQPKGSPWEINVLSVGTRESRPHVLVIACTSCLTPSKGFPSGQTSVYTIQRTLWSEAEWLSSSGTSLSLSLACWPRGTGLMQVEWVNRELSVSLRLGHVIKPNFDQKAFAWESRLFFSY